MNNEQLYERVDAYLSGQMSSEQVNAFQKEVAVNPDLAAELALHQNIEEAILEKEELDDLQEKIGAIFNENKEKTASLPIQAPLLFRSLFRVAAAVALLLLSTLAVYYYVQAKKDKPENLYAAYIDLPESIYERQDNRSTDGQTDKKQLLDSLKDTATQQYRAGNYEEVLITLEKIRVEEIASYSTYPGSLTQGGNIRTERIDNSQLNSPEYYYTLGVVLTQLEQFSAALDTLAKSGGSYTEEAAWKRAVILIRMPNRHDEAIQELEAIIDSNSRYKTQALRLLDKLGAT